MTLEGVDSFAFLVGVVGASHAETYPGGPRYDGEIKLTELSDAACASLSDQVDDKFATVFRAKVGESGLAAALSVEVRRRVLLV